MIIPVLYKLARSLQISISIAGVVMFLDATASQGVILKASPVRLSYMFVNSYTLLPINDLAVMDMGLHCDTGSHSLPNIICPISASMYRRACHVCCFPFFITYRWLLGSWQPLRASSHTEIPLFTLFINPEVIPAHLNLQSRFVLLCTIVLGIMGFVTLILSLYWFPPFKTKIDSFFLAFSFFLVVNVNEHQHPSPLAVLQLNLNMIYNM